MMLEIICKSSYLEMWYKNVTNLPEAKSFQEEEPYQEAAVEGPFQVDIDHCRVLPAAALGA